MKNTKRNKGYSARQYLRKRNLVMLLLSFKFIYVTLWDSK